MPTVNNVAWIIANVVPDTVQIAYPEFYSDPAAVRAAFLMESEQVDDLTYWVDQWVQENPVLPMAIAAYAGHEVSPATMQDRADGRTHFLDVDVSFTFDDAVPLVYRATLLVSELPDRVALIDHRLFDTFEFIQPWSRASEAWDEYVSSLADLLRRNDEAALRRHLFPPVQVRHWFVGHRISPEERESSLAYLTPEEYEEDLTYALEDLFSAVHTALPDADQMELLRYATATTDYFNDGVLIDVQTPSTESAMIFLSATHGPDNIYFSPDDVSAVTGADADEYANDFNGFGFTLHTRVEEMSLAEADQRRRARHRMREECPRFNDALSSYARSPVTTLP